MAIVPNLAVSDLARSLTFYTDVLGMTVTMTVDAAQNFAHGEILPEAVFATLDLDGSMLMLQQVESLAAEVPGVARERPVARNSTVYFRGSDPDVVATRLESGSLLKGPEEQWYGMREVYLTDPDGHVLCVGRPVVGGAPG